MLGALGELQMSVGTDRLDHFVFSGSTKVKLKQMGAAGSLWKE